ncbi:MAG TPA: hypothetical protein DD381_00865 [Lentisphaeria bacterium]|nr:MAG: hypothetical protein A2X47_00155 [Lentisphaerae bacterium GWF2_38_69]HBM14893.1 hypothetical protein [Lentisphaeria bacterium]
MNAFKLSSIPNIDFGSGSLKNLNSHLAKYGKNVLLITGSKSFEKSGNASKIRNSLLEDKFTLHEEKVNSEPTSVLIDEIVSKHRSKNIEALCAIGGGSVLDTGKAVAAMIKETEDIKNFLEGVGNKKPSGRTLPLIAVPTTAGTGSEATKNAVITQSGKNGFKSSLRHDNYIPKTAIIDPELTLNCPVFITACCGLDALSQLVESYLSTQANPFTDTLSLDCIGRILNALPPLCSTSQNNVNLRADISYSAFISGFTLANAGLCVVHGLASTLGYRTNAPHGLICGLLLKQWLKMSAKYLENPLLKKKFNSLASLISKDKNPVTGFLSFLDDFYSSLNLPSLSKYGLTEETIPGIASLSGNKNNPYPVSQKDREYLLRKIL